MILLWIAIVVAAAVFFFLVLPDALVFFAIFYRKKAVPFEKYNQKKFKNHYYIPYLGRIAEARAQLQANPHEEVWIDSYDGLRLYGEYYDQRAEKTAVLFHGIGAEMYTNLSAQALFLYKSGFNVLLCCHRAHGKSGGRWSAVGMREQYDVLSWVDWARQSGAKSIMLYGVSMGAAAVAFAGDKLDPGVVKAAVLDSGFYSVYEQMRRDAIKNNIPKIMLPMECASARLFLRVDLKAAAADSLANSRVPVFLLHGTGDETVESKWCEVNYAACAEPKRMLLVEDAPHTLAILKDPETVETALTEFLQEYFT